MLSIGKHPFSGLWMAAAVAVFLLGAIPAPAQDIVTIAAGSEGGSTKIGGRVLDYNGRQLRMQLAGGLEKTFPADKVLDIETHYAQHHLDADAAMAGGRFQDALALYQKAVEVEAEPRRWVRRQIVAGRVRCYRALGRADRAGEEFLLLIRDDPQTPYFDCIPLAWLPRQPSVSVEQAARQWLLREEPAAVLLGASYLLTTRQRPQATAKLRVLAAGADLCIAQLATAQWWRAAAADADPAQLETWSRAIEQMPEPLRAGPYFVLGNAFLSQKQWQPAALALMRVPILYPRHRALAAQSLADAARAVEQLGQDAEARQLYGELIRDYSEQTAPVAEAKSRVEEMTNDQ